MVSISTKGVYAIAALYTLANAPHQKKMQIKEISALTHISHGYLEQILSTLKKNSFVISTRGALGGYSLAKEAHTIVILDVLECLEGEIFTPLENVGSSVILESFWGQMQEKVREVFKIKLSELDHSYQAYFFDI